MQFQGTDTAAEDSSLPEDQDDLLIVAEMLTMAKSGKYQRGNQFMVECKRHFPDVDEERLRRCAGELGRILRENLS